MRCGTWEKWISDARDGSLTGKRAVRLERHLQDCASCRAYRNDLARVEKRAKDLADPGLAPGEWAEFSRRLEARLATFSASRGAGGHQVDGHQDRRVVLGPTPIWTRLQAGVSYLVLAFLVTYLLVFRPRGVQEPAVVAFEDSLAQVISEIGSNPDLEGAFNQEILASIDEVVRPADVEVSVAFDDNPIFWEGVSEEDLRFIESELRKEHGHGGLT
jgi:hypothetical protein